MPEGAGRLLELMNRERSASGLEPLVSRSDVGQIAIEFSRRTAEEGRLWHNEAYFTQEMMEELEAVAVGENLAIAPSIEDAHARLMDSSDHRANILKAEFTVVGVAVSRDSGGSLYVTQDFLFPRRATR